MSTDSSKAFAKAFFSVFQKAEWSGEFAAFAIAMRDEVRDEYNRLAVSSDGFQSAIRAAVKK